MKVIFFLGIEYEIWIEWYVFFVEIDFMRFHRYTNFLVGIIDAPSLAVFKFAYLCFYFQENYKCWATIFMVFLQHGVIYTNHPVSFTFCCNCYWLQISKTKSSKLFLATVQEKIPIDCGLTPQQPWGFKWSLQYNSSIYVFKYFSRI